MTLVFENAHGTRQVIKTVNTLDEIMLSINTFLTDRHYKAPYYKWNFGESEFCIDVGSHVEFFYLVGNEIELNKIREQL